MSFLIAKQGLRCEQRTHKTGPEQCMCGWPSDEVFIDSRLCKEGEYCWGKSCYPTCMDVPTANNGSCKCYDQWCWKNLWSNVDVFCYPESGCYIPEECPQNFTVFTESEFCSCNRTLIDTSTSFCYENETLPLPSMECPLAPDLAPDEMCICNETLICQPELMCNRVGLANLLIRNSFNSTK